MMQERHIAMPFVAITVTLLIFRNVDAKTTEEKLPDDKLLDRHEEWKFKDPQKYDKDDRAYVNDNHPDNKWNKDTKKNQTKIYNFDTRADQKDGRLHVLLFHVKYQKESGTYDPTAVELDELVHSVNRVLCYYATDQPSISTLVSHKATLTIYLGNGSLTIGSKIGTDYIIFYGNTDVSNASCVSYSCRTFSIKRITKDALVEM